MRILAVPLVVSLLALAACGGSGDDAERTLAQADVPESATITVPGTRLTFGETATVVYAPTETLHSTLTLKVLDARQATVDDLKGLSLDSDYKRNANYYFVHVQVANVGKADLAGQDVPLQGMDAKGVLLPPVSFQADFAACPSKPLPTPFGNDAVDDACLVFLSPDQGALTSIAFRPSDKVQAIEWKAAP